MKIAPFVFLLLFTLTGCTQMLAEHLVETPNQGAMGPFRAWLPEVGKEWFGASHVMRVAVGPPKASLAVWVYDPAGEPRGTVLVLHGLDAEKVWMLDTALALQKAGFRAVLVDDRGHGDSTGDYLTFGVQESKDLSCVLDALQEQKLLAGKVGVYGMSYGAAVAIEFAGSDPRVAAVVAVAPFASMREEIPIYGRRMEPILCGFLSDAEFQKVIDRAGVVAHFDPDAASPLLAAQRTDAPILIMHGDADYMIPIAQSREIQAASPDHVTLEVLANHGHVLAWVDPTGVVVKRTVEWFGEQLEPPTATGSRSVSAGP